MTMSDTQYASWQQNQNVLTAANNDRTNAYNQAKLRGENEDRAQTAAKFAWQKVVDTAGLTGMFEGQYTMPSQQYFANTFGNWGTPTPGQETMAREQQTFGQGATLGNMYGQYYAPGTAPTQGQQTLAGSEQGFTQGLRTQQEARAAQGQGQSQTMGYLNLLAGLRGPADWAKYQQVLGSTPGGMRDLDAAAMGQYVPGGGATTGMQPQAVSLQSMMGDVSGNPYTGQGGGQLNMPDVYNQNTQGMYSQQPQQMQQYGSQPQQGYAQTIQNMMTPPGQAGAGYGMNDQMAAQQAAVAGLGPAGPNAPISPEQAAYSAQWQQYGGMDPAALRAQQAAFTQQNPNAQGWTPAQLQQWQQQQSQRSAQPYQQAVQQQTAAFTPGGGGGYQATNQAYGQSQQQNALGNGTNTMGAQQNQSNLPAPNQIAAQSWENLAPSQQQMLLGDYESRGWDKGDVTALMNQALPKYGSNAASAGTWRLR